MGRHFRHVCKACGHVGVVRKTERVHTGLNRCYCECQNPDCGHVWVANVEFSHTIKPSKITETGILRYFVNKMSPTEVAEMQNLLNARKASFAN